MMGRVFCILALVATLGGCERAGLFKSNAPTFDGQRFRTKVSTERSNRQAFAVTVHGVSKSPEGARAAGAHKATQHCIQFYGTSDIDWVVGPEAEPAAMPVVNDAITLRGACRDV